MRLKFVLLPALLFFFSPQLSFAEGAPSMENISITIEDLRALQTISKRLVTSNQKLRSNLEISLSSLTALEASLVKSQETSLTLTRKLSTAEESLLYSQTSLKEYQKKTEREKQILEAERNLAITGIAGALIAGVIIGGLIR